MDLNSDQNFLLLDFKGHWHPKFLLPILKGLHHLTMNIIIILYQTFSFARYLQLKSPYRPPF